MPPHSHGQGADARTPDEGSERVAELVAQLTGYGTHDARDAVAEAHTITSGDRHAVAADALELVARAVQRLGGPADGSEAPRMTGYVRSGRGTQAPVIDLREPARCAVEEDADTAQGLRVTPYVGRRTDRPHLVEHSSLRRWERSTVPTC